MKPRAGDHPADRLDGAAPAIQALRAQIRHLATFDVVGGAMVPTLLLQGETGTGKGLVARVVHDGGPRARGPFVPVNCAAIPETMLEAELFGFEAGAFTDAKRGKPGLFEAAAAGTLFLDEIDSLSLALQSKLLTAIEAKRIRRLGSVVEHVVDVKLIVATQRDLGRLAADGRFRADLFHRLAVVVLVLPPLRERGDDVLELARVMLERFAAAYGAAPKRLGADAQAWIKAQPWPGNVRELGHMMERVMLLHNGGEIDARGLERLATPSGASGSAPALVAAPAPHPALPVADERTVAAGPASLAAEARAIREALARTGGNVLKAARLLGVSRDTVRYRMRRHGIGRPDLTSLASSSPAPRRGSDDTKVAIAEPASSHATRADPIPARAAEALPKGAVAPWEQKQVAILVIELAWANPDEPGVPSHEPWTEAARWERAIREKVEGLGALLLQRSPALLVEAFGIPHTLEQMPQRAVHAALAVRNLLAGLTARERAPAVRIAVHLGAMLVDPTAEDPAARAIPVGDALTVPVRLLGAVAPGEIVASGEVARQVEAWVRLEPVEMSGSVAAVFRIAGLSPSRERGRGRFGSRLSPFVGRESELGTLTGLLELSATGSGQVVGIVGGPGSGKSRLLSELRRRLLERGVRYDEGRCLAQGSLTPYHPLIEMLKVYFEVADSAGADAIEAQVRSGLGALHMDPEVHAPALLPLLGVSRHDGDAEDSQARTFDTVCQMVLTLARRQPYVLALENAHWIDPTTEECFAALAEQAHGAPLLLLTSYREGYRPPWLGKSYATQIALRPLGGAESRQIVRAAMADTALAPDVEEQVLAKAEGNPFFLEELARAIVEHQGAAGPVIPDTVHAVLDVRIDGLAAGDKRLLQVAATIGRSVRLALLEAVSQVDRPAMIESLSRLTAGEFLFERSEGPEPVVAFKSALTQAAAYHGLPGSTRQRLHQRVLDALEALDGEPLPERLEERAHHAMEALAWDEAAGYSRRAGHRAMEHHAAREAASAFEQALAALGQLRDGRDRSKQVSDVHFDLALTLYWRGEFERALDHATEGIDARRGAGR